VLARFRLRVHQTQSTIRPRAQRNACNRRYDYAQHCSLNRWIQTPFQFQKRSQLFIGTHNETPAVVAVRVNNEDCLSVRVDG
jgi:hypothetical protein